jgi:uncharacterized membrane protein YgcG
MIIRSQNRLARLAVIRAVLHAALPLAATLAIALDLNVLNALAFDHFGYLMEAASARVFQQSLFGLTLIQFVAIALIAWRARGRSRDLVWTAEQIDRCVDGRQEVVTLAILSDPTNPKAANLRSSLFPMLRERVFTYLGAFDPRAAFRLEFREPLWRSFVLAALAVILVSSAAFALMTRATPMQSVVHRLQLLSDTIGTSATGLAQQPLVDAARDVAQDLINPKLPPQVKRAELQALERELEKFQKQHSSASTGKGNSSGGGNGNGRGDGQGVGSGSGSGNGSGLSQNGSGAANHGKGSQQLVELHNDIAKAQIKLEQEADSANQRTAARNDSSNGRRTAPRPGTNPNQPGGQNSSKGSGPVPQPSGLASSKMPSGYSPSAPRGDRGSMGDTHLGEFPKAGNYQRFYKLGERGPAINVRDARYVSFQLPTEIEAAARGAMVADNTRPQARTPYTNSPLKQERLPVLPDEQQLVPPRYRELIH